MLHIQEYLNEPHSEIKGRQTCEERNKELLTFDYTDKRRKWQRLIFKDPSLVGCDDASL
jgi:hypothetical protein